MWVLGKISKMTSTCLHELPVVNRELSIIVLDKGDQQEYIKIGMKI